MAAYLRGGMGARLLLAAGSAIGGGTLLASLHPPHPHHPRDGLIHRRGSKMNIVLSSPRGVWGGGPAQCHGATTGLHGQGRGGGHGAPMMLREVLEMSKATDTESLPWVWLDRNPHGSCHVFVGDAPELLHKMKKTAKADPNGTLVLVRPGSSSSSSSNSKAAATIEERENLEKLGIAVLEGAVERVDPEGGLLLTRDERIIEFDSLTVMWRHSGGEEEQEGERIFPPTHAELVQKRLSEGCQKCGTYVAPVSRAPDAPCTGCSHIVKRKSLHAGGEGLHQIVQTWRMSRNDTWPWVWLARNPDGPLHVIVAHGREAFDAVKERSNASPGSNILLVGKRSELLALAPESDYDKHGCAIVDANVEELDAAHGIVMLTDERVIEFDTLTIIHSSQTAEA